MNKLTSFFSFNFQGFNWGILKTYDFWFGYDRTMIHATEKLIFLAAALLVLAGLVCLIYTLFVKNEFLEKIAKWIAKIYIIIGLLEIFWFLLRFQNVQVFGTRFVAALIAVIGLIWIYFPIKYFFTKYKVDMAEAERKASRDKYLNYYKK